MSGGRILSLLYTSTSLGISSNNRVVHALPFRYANTRHLLLECPDIALMAATPAMVEAWMNEHVGRYGGISAWRVLGPCSALALTLESAEQASAAAVGLDGTTLLMRPLAAYFLDEFPNNEQLAGHVQKVATRMIGSGTVYMEAMARGWQHIQELSPMELRGPPHQRPY